MAAGAGVCWCVWVCVCVCVCVCVMLLAVALPPLHTGVLGVQTSMCNVETRQSATLMSCQRRLERDKRARCTTGAALHVRAGRSNWLQGASGVGDVLAARPRVGNRQRSHASPHSTASLTLAVSLCRRVSLALVAGRWSLLTTLLALAPRPSPLAVGASVPARWAGRDAATQLAACCGPLKQCPQHGGVCVFAARIHRVVSWCVD